MQTKLIKNSVICMGKCSLAASALNLSTYLLNIFGIVIVLYNLVAYIVLGTPVYYLLRKKALAIQVIAIWLIVNVVSVSGLTYFLLKPPSEPGGHCVSPFVFILPATSVIAGLLSVFPIIYFCRKAKKKMENDPEIETFQDTND